MASRIPKKSFQRTMTMFLCISVSVFFFSIPAHSQSLSSSVLTTSGSHMVSTEGILTWSVGELVIATYTQPVGVFSQGFHQPLMQASQVTGLSETEKEILLSYPNPVSDFLYVQTREKGNYSIAVFNLQGQLLVEDRSSVISMEEPHVIDMHAFIPAMYLLRVMNNDTDKTHHLKIEKH